MPQAMKSLAKPKAGPDVIKRRNRQLVGQLDYDVVVCGGTLGLLLALSLQVCRAQVDSGSSCLTVWHGAATEHTAPTAACMV